MIVAVQPPTQRGSWAVGPSAASAGGRGHDGGGRT